jgi:hypothetical protein
VVGDRGIEIDRNEDDVIEAADHAGAWILRLD